jgi:hypothetical protein
VGPAHNVKAQLYVYAPKGYAPFGLVKVKAQLDVGPLVVENVTLLLGFGK